MPKIAVTPSFGLRYPACPDCQPCPNCPGGLDAFENLARDTDSALASVEADIAAVSASLPNLPGRLIRRHRRLSNSSATTGSAVGILRLPVGALITGRAYLIMTNSALVDGSTATDVARLELRYTTDGTTPTTASALLPGGLAQGQIGNAAQGPSLQITTIYVPAGAGENLHLLLDITLTAGVGATVTVAGSGNTVTDLYVFDVGPDPGATGVNL